jgi:uncharacterized protein
VLANLFPGPRLYEPVRLHDVLLSDGDRLVLHDSVPRRWRPGQMIVLLVHGLGGSHRSGYMVRLTNALTLQHVRVVRLDLRGAGAGAAVARKLYNGGCSADVRAALAEVARWAPDSPLLLVGLSLGGNIALKLAGEAASARVPGLAAVAALAPPIDLEACAEAIAQPCNRLYETYYVRALIRQVSRHRRFSRNERPVRFPRGTTLRQFDDLYTAPRGGFADALDYYRRASALPLLGRIALPSYILAARDDPFIPVVIFERLSRPAPMEIQLAPHGGHLGFLGWDGNGGIRWAERRLVEWIVSHAKPAPPSSRQVPS